MENKSDVRSFSNGEITIWVEQNSSIQIKATSPHGDPIELSCEEAKELAQHLLRLAAVIE